MKCISFWFFMFRFILCTCGIANAQRYTAINTFTTEQGLPSNHVYEAVQDSLGFLWLATDNGVSRFDGKYFTNFTVADGLPSNDVIQIKITADGTLWANSYRHVPTYFDYKANRFIVPPCSEKAKIICGEYIQAFQSYHNNRDIFEDMWSILQDILDDEFITMLNGYSKQF